MAKQALKKDEKVVEVMCMSVAGGELNLPKGHKYFVNLRLDYSEVDYNEAIMLASEGSSVRVKAQAKLRGMEAELKKKGKVAESSADVDAQDLGWFDFNVAHDFEKAERGGVDPEKRAASAIKKMSVEQRVKLLMAQFGVDEGTARNWAENVK